MAIPGSPASLLPAGDDEIMRRLRDADRRMDELGPSVAASIKPTMDELRAAQATLAATVADLAAQQAVLTELVNRVVVPSAIYQRATGFAMTAGYQIKAQITLSTPAEFTKAVVVATASARVMDTAVGDPEVWMSIVVAGATGPVDDRFLAGGSGSFSSSLTQLVTGLTAGSPIVISNQVAAGAAMAADATNEAVISGAVFWFR